MSNKISKKVLSAAIAQLVHSIMATRILTTYERFSSEYVDLVGQARKFHRLNTDADVAQWATVLGGLAQWDRNLRLTNEFVVTNHWGIHNLYKSDPGRYVFRDLLDADEEGSMWPDIRVILPFRVPGILCSFLESVDTYCRTCRKDDYEPDDRDKVIIAFVNENEGPVRYVRELGEAVEGLLNEADQLFDAIQERIGKDRYYESVTNLLPELASYLDTPEVVEQDSVDIHELIRKAGATE